MSLSIIDTIIKNRRGNYCHAVEVEYDYELECIVESIIEEFPNRTEKEYLDFFNTLEVYALSEDREDEVYNFSFCDYIRDTI